MSKNVFDYIVMGLRSKKTIEDKKQEAQKKRESEANAFDKAFTDKTYTVAKKVLDNVEKVADYDYDALFDRVNKAIDNKLPKSTKNVSSKEREYRSKEFDKKVSTHTERFSIDDYLSKQANYKNSILEKTKKNIQKKYTEAEIKNKSIQPLDRTVESKTEVNLDSKASENLINIIDSGVEKTVKAEDKKTTVNVKNKSDKVKNILSDDNIELDEKSIENNLNVDEGKSNVERETSKDLTGNTDEDKESVDINNNSENNKVDKKKNLFNIIDEALVKSTTNLDKALIGSTKKLDNALSESTKSLDDALNESTHNLDNKIVQLDKKIIVAKEILDSTLDSVVLKTKPQEQSKTEKASLVDVSHDSSQTKLQTSIEPDDNEPVTEYTDEVQSDDETPVPGKVDTEYSKEDQIRQNRYYKNKKRDKFAKRMKVELEDSLIGQKKRSFKRLFKFSLSFKLSFVFMLLIVLTVVSLSVAFYLGIDYVIELKELGKLEDIQFFKDVLIVLLIIFDMAAVLICISLGTKASRELVRPIDEMTQIVNQISVKDMNRRLNVKGMHDELKELAMTFNEMLDRIEHSYETQNRFTSDASHELRTPIAVIQGYINMLDRWGKADGEILDESIEAIKSESHNMKRLTEKLLLLAKADKGILEMDFQHFELNELIKEISRETQMIDTHHEISNEINEVKTIMADRESLKQAIRIFVDNSVKYTPEGGKVSINSYINKNKIYIEIADNGIGISKEDMANIFNRFYRVDKSRTKDSGGHGLGLSIAKWIISQHKGEIEIKSEINKGTVVTLVLSPIKE